jgi:hypothetical protein
MYHSLKLFFQLSGFCRIMFHADAPDQFFRADNAGAGRQAFNTPNHGGIPADATLGCRVLLRHILAISSVPGACLK